MASKYFLFFVLVCTWGSTLFAQQLRGVVLNRSNDSRPEEGVSLTFLTGGANPVTTTSNGIFQAECRGVLPGDPVEIIVQKEGYVLLGADEAIFRTSMPSGGTTLRLAIATKKAFDNLRADYVSGIENQLKYANRERQQLIQRLTNETLSSDERQALSKIISEQSQQINSLRQNKEDLARRLARIDLNKTSAFAREALNKFRDEGNVTKALDLMSAARVDDFWQQVVSQEEKLKRAREQGIENFMIRARLLRANLDFAKADSAFKKAIRLDEKNFTNSIEYGIFLAKQKQSLRAIGVHENLLNQVLTKNQRAKALNNLCLLYRQNKLFTEAEKACEQAMNLKSELVDSSDSKSLLNLAGTIENMGLLNRAMKNTDAAEYNFLRARKIILDSPLQASNTTRRLLALNLVNTANLRLQLRRFSEAEKDYLQALGIFRELTVSDSLKYTNQIFATLNNLSTLYRTTRNFEEAKKHYTEATEVVRLLAKRNPIRYNQELAKHLNNFGNFNSVRKNFNESEKAYNEAIEIRRDLTGMSEAVHKYELAVSLQNLGILYLKNRKFSKAKILLAEALKTLQELEKNEGATKDISDGIAGNLGSLGLIRRYEKQYDQAIKLFEEALEIRRRLTNENELYLPKLAGILNNCGTTMRFAKKYTKAEEYHLEALSIFRELAASSRSTFSYQVAYSLNQIGTLCSATNRYENSLKYFTESLRIRSDNFLNGRTNSRREVNNSLAIIRQLRDTLNNHLLFDLALDAQRTVANYLEQISLKEKSVISQASLAQGNLAWQAIFARQNTVAYAAAKRALDLDPQAEWVNTNLALAELFLGNREAAKSIYLRHKDKPFPNDPAGRDFRSVFRADLAELAAAGIVPKRRKEVNRWLD